VEIPCLYLPQPFLLQIAFLHSDLPEPPPGLAKTNKMQRIAQDAMQNLLPVDDKTLFLIFF